MTSNPQPHRWAGMALIAMLLAATALTVGAQSLFPAPAVAMSDEEGPCDDPNLEFWQWLEECGDSGGGSDGGSSGSGGGSGDGSNPFPNDWEFSDAGTVNSPPAGKSPSGGSIETRGHEIVIVVDKVAKETDEQETPEECFKRLRWACGVNCPPDRMQCLHVIPNHVDRGREWPEKHGRPRMPYLPKTNHKKRSLELLMKWIPECKAARAKLDALAKLRAQGWSDRNWEAFGKKKQQEAAEIVWRGHECGRILIET
jgi:hypothetical protein